MAPFHNHDTTHEATQRKRFSDILEKAARIAAECSDVEDEDETDSVAHSVEKRRITFSSPTSIHHDYINLDEYTESEIKKCWYSAEEKQKMISNKDKVVVRIEEGKPPKSNMTYRGLDCWTVEGGRRLDVNIARVVDAVMDEQDRQWTVNVDDHDRIALVSQEVTKICKNAARKIALEDEKEAREALEEFADNSSTLSESVEEKKEQGGVKKSSKKTCKSKKTSDSSKTFGKGSKQDSQRRKVSTEKPSDIMMKMAIASRKVKLFNIKF